MSGLLVSLLLGLGAVTLLGACSSPELGEPDAAASAVRSQQGEAATPTTVEEEPVVRPLRDDDVTDTEVLAAQISAGAEGDPEWIEVFAEVRARGWLANRYPGEYDITSIYSEEWAAETAEPNESEWLALGVYLDEPLPRLISVAETRQLGALTELEVVIEADPAVVRFVSDDSAQADFPGGRARGLFTVAQDGPAKQWRIHSVVELRMLDDANADPNAEESNP